MSKEALNERFRAPLANALHPVLVFRALSAAGMGLLRGLGRMPQDASCTDYWVGIG